MTPWQFPAIEGNYILERIWFDEWRRRLFETQALPFKDTDFFFFWTPEEEMLWWPIKTTFYFTTTTN